VRHLRAFDVTHRFGKEPPVLRDVNFELAADGSSVAVIAPSGSGKTTLLALLGGLMPPSEGAVSIAVDGREEPSISHVSWVLQTANFLSRRTTRDNAAIGALARGEPLGQVHARVDEVLERVGLAAAAHKAAALLSGGEAQRLSVARAVASRTPFVLADEPTGQLDRSSSERVAEILFDATRAFRCGLLLVTHDQDLAHRCDRVLQLREGQLCD